MVQATPDEMGLIILVNLEVSSVCIFSMLSMVNFVRLGALSGPTLIYEIFRNFHEDRTVVRVWDYRANYSTCFAAICCRCTFCSFQNAKISLKLIHWANVNGKR